MGLGNLFLGLVAPTSSLANGFLPNKASVGTQDSQNVGIGKTYDSNTSLYEILYEFKT
jgi:hypothetical protein